MTMAGFTSSEVERKVNSVLRILTQSHEPLGARVIAHRLKDYGVELTERAVRYHLKLMDERGLTRLVGRDGRVVTEAGREEIKSALVRDKVGFAISRIELLAFHTNFNLEKRTGVVPVNISIFPKERFNKALQVMRPIFARGLCVSSLVAVAREGESLGDYVVSPGKVGLATVCSIVINGTLLKVGVPIDSRFAGILQMRDYKPLRFVELIHYDGCSLDPSEIFIRAGMTSVAKAASKGNGNILANYRELPAVCLPIVQDVVVRLKEAGLGGLLIMGNVSEPVCEVTVELNRVGMILLGGLNPVAAASEAGIEVENHAMSLVMDYEKLGNFEELF